MHERGRSWTWVGALLVSLAACSPPAEPLKVTAIDLANKIDAKNRVHSPGMTFAPTSTVYASIATEGSGSATLAARWLDASDQVLAEQTQTVTATEPSHFAFSHKPPDGWKPGLYKVIITIDGKEPRPRDFQVR